MTTKIIQGDCRDVLRTLPDESVHCVVTSPPYWGLRDYGVDGQIGLEKSPDVFVSELAAVFCDVRRVLRADGTAWLNLGDSYSSGGHAAPQVAHGGLDGPATPKDGLRRVPANIAGIKPKDLCGIPWRVAFALQADGWYLRQDIIWSKPNPMPESVRDRCTKAHEYIFLLSKSERYYFDQGAIAEPCSPNTHARISQDIANQIGCYRANGGAKTNGPLKAVVKGSTRKLAKPGYGIKNNDSFADAVCLLTDKRNRRSVWEVTTQTFSDAHFATFPPALVEPCILAGCPKGGTVLDPFFGAGTTGLVADRLGRDCIGIELNPDYAAMAERRIRNESPLYAQVTISAPPPPQNRIRS